MPKMVTACQCLLIEVAHIFDRYCHHQHLYQVYHIYKMTMCTGNKAYLPWNRGVSITICWWYIFPRSAITCGTASSSEIRFGWPYAAGDSDTWKCCRYMYSKRTSATWPPCRISSVRASRANICTGHSFTIASQLPSQLTTYMTKQSG